MNAIKTKIYFLSYCLLSTVSVFASPNKSHQPKRCSLQALVSAGHGKKIDNLLDLLKIAKFEQFLELSISEKHQGHRNAFVLHECLKAMKNNSLMIDLYDLEKAIKHVIATKNYSLIKSPRQTNGNNGIVGGTIINCNQDRLLELLNFLENLIISCCQELEIDFQGTFTAIDALNSILTNSTLFPCNAIPITGPISIEESGYYCLANDIEGSIIIDANNVVLDLNNHRITTNHVGDAITVNVGINRTIKNGILTSSRFGMVLSGNFSTNVSNVLMSFCDAGGMTIDNSTNLLLDSITIENTFVGLLFLNSNNANILRNITVSQSEQGFIFQFLSNSLLQNCAFLDGDSVSGPIFGVNNCGFGLFGGSNNHLNNCSVKTYNAFNASVGFLIDSSDSIVLQNCLAQSISSFFPPTDAIANGFLCTELSSNIQFLNCSVSDVHGQTLSSGFQLLGNDLVVDSCISQSALSRTILENSIGFLCSGTNLALTNCQALGSFDGFNVINSASLQNCQGLYNSNGFTLLDSTPLLGNCTAYKNSVGFTTASSAFIYKCFSSGNSVNNYINVPNTQNANAQVDTTIIGPSGPIAGGNLFM